MDLKYRKPKSVEKAVTPLLCALPSLRTRAAPAAGRETTSGMVARLFLRSRTSNSQAAEYDVRPWSRSLAPSAVVAAGGRSTPRGPAGASEL
ncbi:hypothetical protein EVAR_87913_1 [Eumeta japonica]|uniref:Uncharacterized protein n=1 Tax=Eumeta variegata TaxID=151549 RepID=A0A4C1WXD1_EUMVA|nr:hypothetical protein EVAR_87913_1 [Eumeta japonica]